MRLGRRRFSLLLALPALLAVTPAAGASERARGAVSVSLAGGHGRAVLVHRGSVNLRVGTGRVRITDLRGGKRPAWDCNGESSKVWRIRRSPSTVDYGGTDVRCLVWGRGPWRVAALGRGVHASGVVRGALTLNARNAGPAGRYQVGGRPWASWPRATRTFRLSG